MPLSSRAIKSKIEKGEISIEPFSEERVTPNGYDLSLSSEVFEMKDISKPINVLNENSVTSFLERKNVNEGIKLKPFKPISVVSKERISIDSSLVAELHGRSSIGKMGIFPHFGSGIIDSGFGMDSPQRVVFTLMSCNPNTIILHPNQPVSQLIFHLSENPIKETTQYSTYSTSVYPEFDIDEITDGEEITIGITGLAAAGKSEVARLFSDILSADIHSMGSIIRKEAEKRGYKPSGDNLRKVSIQLREDNDEGIIAELLAEKIRQKQGRKRKIIEGIRSTEEVNTLQEQLESHLIMIGVHSSPETRLKRMGERERIDDKANEEYLQKRDEKEANFGVREIMTNSDYMINNEGSLKELERSAENISTRILQDVCQDVGWFNKD